MSNSCDDIKGLFALSTSFFTGDPKVMMTDFWHVQKCEQCIFNIMLRILHDAWLFNQSAEREIVATMKW
jgi:hypothetical protein